MDTMTAFAIGQANRDKEMMLFDWLKAAELIQAHHAVEARAGLAGDWEWTGGNIYADGKPVLDDYTYLASTWAVPQIDIDGHVMDCFVMQSQAPGWSSDTKWPTEAITALNGGA